MVRPCRVSCYVVFVYITLIFWTQLDETHTLRVDCARLIYWSYFPLVKGDVNNLVEKKNEGRNERKNCDGRQTIRTEEEGNIFFWLNSPNSLCYIRSFMWYIVVTSLKTR